MARILKYGGVKFWMDLVDGLYERVMQDEVLNKFFLGHDMARVKEMNQSLVLSALFGGHFPSHQIRCRHASLHISKADYARFLQLYGSHLTEHHVAPDDVASILDALVKYQDSVVGSEDIEV